TLELFAQFIDHRIDHFLVIDVQGAGDLVFRRARKVERLFLDQPNARDRFVNHVGDAQIDVIAGHRQAESEHRDGQESDTDVAHSASATDADAGEILLLQLREDDGQAFVDSLGFVSERMHEILDHRFVINEVGFGAVATSRDAEAKQLVLTPARDHRLDDRLNDLLAHRLLRIHHAVLHRASRFGAEEAGETFGVVAENIKVFPVAVKNHLVLLQNSLCHFRVGDGHEGVELRLRFMSVRAAGHYDAARADIQSNRAYFIALQGGFCRDRVIVFHYYSIPPVAFY